VPVVCVQIGRSILHGPELFGVNEAAPSEATEKTVRKRRSLSFWLLTALLVVLAVPLILFLIALGYVKSGGANERVLSEVKKIFGDKVTVASTSSDWLNNLRIHQLAVDGPDGKRALDVREVNVEWDPQELIGENRIREMQVLGPKATLARDADAKWNLKLKPSQSSGEKFRIDQIRIGEGEVFFEPQPGHAIHLQALSGNISNSGPTAPQAFAFYGVFDSLNTLSLNGTIGPGAAFTARGDGSIDLQRDAGALLSNWLPTGSEGRMRLSLSARSDALIVDEKRAGPLKIDGALDFEKARVLLPGGWALKLDRDRIDVRSEIVQPSKPEEALTLSDFSLRATPALNFYGALAFPPAGGVRIDNASAEIDSAALLARMEPSLLPSSMTLRGAINIEQAHLNTAGTFAAKANVRGDDLRMTLKNLGELPPLGLAGTLNWPAIEKTTLKVGNAGRISFSLKDTRLDTTRIAQELIDKAQVHSFEIDVAQLWESDLGRRLLTGTLDPAATPLPAGQLPFHVKGALLGTDLKFVVEPKSTDLQRVALTGVQSRDLAILKWPFPFNVPARTFSGPMQFEFDLRKDGSFESFAIAKKLTSSGPKDETPTEIVMAQRFGMESGSMRMGPLRLQSVTIPFANLDQIFGIRTLTGLTSTGLARFRDVECDLVTKDVSGDFDIEKGRFLIPFPVSAQKAVINGLRSMDYPTIAAIFESYPVEELALTDVAIKGRAEMKSGKLTLKGRSEKCVLNAVLPVSIPLFQSLKEQDLTKLPAADFTLAMDTKLPPGQRAMSLLLDWGGGKALTINLKEQGRAEAWSVTGSLKIPGEEGLSATFDAPFDLAAQTVGPVSANIDEIVLDPIAGRFMKNPQGLPALSGKMRDVRLDLRTINLKNASAASIANGKLSGQLENVAYSAPPLAEFAQLTGPFTFDLQSRGETFGVNALFKLTNYEALLNDGAVYITQPEAGKFGAIRWVGTVRRDATGITIQQNQAEMALEDDVSAEASGQIRINGDQLAFAKFETLRIFAKDLKRTIAKYVKPHLEHRAPWFGDIGLEGTAHFDGTLDTEAGKATNLKGSLALQNARVTLGQGAPFRVEGLNGALPVLLQFGAASNASSAEVRQTELTIGPLISDSLRAERQTLKLAAMANALRVETPLRVETVLGTVTLGGITLRNMLSSTQEPAIDFTLATRINLDKILKENGVVINGMEETVLGGEPLVCTLEKTSGLRGPWALNTRGALKGPFYGGSVVLENLKARGIFGPAPVFGADCAVTGSADGIKWTQFSLKNQQLGEKISGVPGKEFGKISLRANAAIRGIEMTAPNVAGVQAFVFDLDSVPYKDNEFYFDGEMAMTLNEPLVRAAFPSILFGRDKIARMTFGVKNIGVQYELRDGGLYGPRPKLPNDLILEGYGTDSGIGAIFERRLRQDIKGDYKNVTPWATIVKSLQQRKNAPVAPTAK